MALRSSDRSSDTHVERLRASSHATASNHCKSHKKLHNSHIGARGTRRRMGAIHPSAVSTQRRPNVLSYSKKLALMAKTSSPFFCHVRRIVRPVPIEPKMRSGGRHAVEISNEDVTFVFVFVFVCNVCNSCSSVNRPVGYSFYVVTSDVLSVPSPYLYKYLAGGL